MASVDGLISGLNTSDIIKQLMQLERQPQVRLQAKQTTVENAISALRDLNTKFLSIKTAAAKLTTGTGWQLATATSSDTSRVTVSATAGAAQGSLSFHVKQLAAASTYLSAGSVTATSDAVTAANATLTITKGSTGTPVEINTGDGSLGAVVNAINGSGAGVTATAVQLTTGEYRLQLSSTTTGADTGITIKDAAGGDPFATTLGTLDPLVVGANAQLDVGGNLVERSSNTISDLLSGVTLTVTKPDKRNADGTYADPPVTIEVKADAEGIAAQVSALVDAVNLARSDIKAATHYNLETKNKGKLYGDAGVRALRDQLGGAVVGDGTSSAGLVGVSMTRDGTVAFDKEKFLKALEADPAAVESALGASGLAGRLEAVATRASSSTTSAEGPGLIANAITSRESQVTSLKSNISSWDNRLELRERTLQRQYAALEMALGASQSQGQWLAGQIAGLPSWGS
jgi:flagellar hook-associated protein 2